MATLYVKSAGGNWTAAGTWSNVNAAGVDNSGPPTAADDAIAELASGNLTVNAASVCKSFSAIAGTGDWTGTLTHSAGVSLTVSGNLTFSGGMTFTMGNTTNSIAINATGTFISAGKLTSVFTCNAAVTLGDNYTSSAQALANIAIGSSGSLNLNGKTAAGGNSTTNRIMIKGTTMGTSGSLIVNGGTFANADFRDIAFSNATDLDISAITGLSGDCGGNTLVGGGSTLTFTPAATQTWSGTSGGNWTANAWTSRVPLAQDNVVISSAFSASQTITNNMARMGKSIDFTGTTGNPTLTVSTPGQEIFGSLILVSGMSVISTQTLTFSGRGAFTLTPAGTTFAGITLTMFGGSLTLGSAFLGTTFTLTNGGFSDGGFIASFTSFSSTNSNLRSVTRTTTWTVTGTGTVYTHATATNLTLVDSGTVAITDTSVTSKTFAGGGLTYNNVLISGGGTGAIIFTGANTFSRIYTDGGGTKSITLPGSTTTTISSSLGLSNGTNVITFTASAGSATVGHPSASGILSWDYVSLTNIPITGSTGYAGANSTDGGGNTGWVFTVPPASGGSVTSRGRNRGRNTRS